MGIVVSGAVFVDIRGYPESNLISNGRNVGRVEQIHGGIGDRDIRKCLSPVPAP